MMEDRYKTAAIRRRTHLVMVQLGRLLRQAEGRHVSADEVIYRGLHVLGKILRGEAELVEHPAESEVAG